MLKGRGGSSSPSGYQNAKGMGIRFEVDGGHILCWRGAAALGNERGGAQVAEGKLGAQAAPGHSAVADD